MLCANRISWCHFLRIGIVVFRFSKTIPGTLRLSRLAASNGRNAEASKGGEVLRSEFKMKSASRIEVHIFRERMKK